MHNTPHSLIRTPYLGIISNNAAIDLPGWHGFESLGGHLSAPNLLKGSVCGPELNHVGKLLTSFRVLIVQ